MLVILKISILSGEIRKEVYRYFIGFRNIFWVCWSINCSSAGTEINSGNNLAPVFFFSQYPPPPLYPSAFAKPLIEITRCWLSRLATGKDISPSYFVIFYNSLKFVTSFHFNIVIWFCPVSITLPDFFSINCKSIFGELTTFCDFFLIWVFYSEKL